MLGMTHDIAGEKIEDWIFAIIYRDDRWMFDFWVWELWVAFIKLKILIYIYYKTKASDQYLTFFRVLTFLHISIIKKKKYIYIYIYLFSPTKYKL